MNLLVQFFQLMCETFDELIVSHAMYGIFPLRFGVVEFFDHATDFLDSTQSFVVPLNGWHDGQVMGVQRQEPTFR